MAGLMPHLNAPAGRPSAWATPVAEVKTIFPIGTGCDTHVMLRPIFECFEQYFRPAGCGADDGNRTRVFSLGS